MLDSVRRSFVPSPKEIVGGLIVSLLVSAYPTWRTLKIESDYAVPLAFVIGLAVLGLSLFAINNLKTFLQRRERFRDSVKLKAMLTGWLFNSAFSVEEIPDPAMHFRLLVRQDSYSFYCNVFRHNENEDVLHITHRSEIHGTLQKKLSEMTEVARSNITYDLVIAMSVLGVSFEVTEPIQYLHIQAQVTLDETFSEKQFLDSLRLVSRAKITADATLARHVRTPGFRVETILTRRSV